MFGCKLQQNDHINLSENHILYLSHMECSICGKSNACVECCNIKLCLIDFLCSMHSAHVEKSMIIAKEQFNKDLEHCKTVFREVML